MKVNLYNNFMNIGDYFLEDEFNKSKIYFLGAKNLNDDLWSINLSFERIEYKYDDGCTCNANGDNSFGYGYAYASSDTFSIEASISESLYFADYLGRKITSVLYKHWLFFKFILISIYIFVYLYLR